QVQQKDDLNRYFDMRSMNHSMMENCLNGLQLCPVVLPDGASHAFEELVAQLPLYLINPPNLTDTGDHLWEGDMVLTPEEMSAIMSNTDERKGTSVKAQLWPRNSETGYPTIPYKMSNIVTDPNMVRKAMNVIEEHTCMRFKLITDGIYKRRFLKITKGTGCWSYVGMTSTNGQSLSLGSGCYK
ncbi:unnamed protein product, partial [Meganyctiphanes norvegica]